MTTTRFNKQRRSNFRNAVAKRSGDAAFRLPPELQKRFGAPLPAAVQKHPLSDPLQSDPCDTIAAFTLVELLIVLAVLALWVMLLAPALAHTQPDTRAFQCLNNSRQLTRAWLMYADDNKDKLATSNFGSATYGGVLPAWAIGWLDWANGTDNTNTVFLSDPRYSILAPYCGKSARLFKCPADQYIGAAQRVLGWKERARSVAQNLFAATSNIEEFPIDPSYLHVTKFTRLLNPKPEATWVSMDEHPDSINDGCLFPPSPTQWIDLPANYHDGGAGIAYADGHSEIHRWQGNLLRVPIKFAFTAPAMTPNDPDYRWLRYRTPRQPGVN